jgi:hypothetical protein
LVRSPLVNSQPPCFLVSPGPEAFAHAGYGNEFHDSASHSTGKQIRIDAETAQRIGLKVEAVGRQSLDSRIPATEKIERLPNQKVEITNPVGHHYSALSSTGRRRQSRIGLGRYDQWRIGRTAN